MLGPFLSEQRFGKKRKKGGPKGQQEKQRKRKKMASSDDDSDIETGLSRYDDNSDDELNQEELLEMDAVFGLRDKGAMVCFFFLFFLLFPLCFFFSIPVSFTYLSFFLSGTKAYQKQQKENVRET